MGVGSRFRFLLVVVGRGVLGVVGDSFRIFKFRHVGVLSGSQEGDGIGVLGSTGDSGDSESKDESSTNSGHGESEDDSSSNSGHGESESELE